MMRDTDPGCRDSVHSSLISTGLGSDVAEAKLSESVLDGWGPVDVDTVDVLACESYITEGRDQTSITVECSSAPIPSRENLLEYLLLELSNSFLRVILSPIVGIVDSVFSVGVSGSYENVNMRIWFDVQYLFDPSCGFLRQHAVTNREGGSKSSRESVMPLRGWFVAEAARSPDV